MARRKRQDRQHKLIGFKAYSDTDADLIAWWENISSGQRSDTLRHLLRVALGYAQVVPQAAADTDMAQVAEDIAWLRDALNELPNYVEQVMVHVASNAQVMPQGNSPTTSRTDLIDEEAVQRRKERMKRRRW